MTKPEEQRRRHRQTVVECSALVDLLVELNPPTNRPALNATDREIGAWLGRQELIAGLLKLREETLVPNVLGG